MTNVMNELEFRRRVQLNPHDLDADCQAFLDSAEPALRNELERFQRRCVVEQDADLRDIRAALNVSVPDGLAERALLRTAHRGKKTQWMSWLSGLRVPIAAFASIAIATVGAMMLLKSEPLSVAAKIAVNHIASEPAHTHLGNHIPKSHKQVQRVFGGIGLRLNEEIKGVAFASNCDVEGKLGAHLLLSRAGKPVTVLVFPQKDRSQADLDYGGEMVAMPYGSLAVFADDDAARREVLNSFKQGLVPNQVAMLNPR